MFSRKSDERHSSSCKNDGAACGGQPLEITSPLHSISGPLKQPCHAQWEFPGRVTGGRWCLGNAQSSNTVLSIKSNQHINQTDKPELPTSLQSDLLSRLGFLKLLFRKYWIKFRIGRSWASVQNSRYLYCLVCARFLNFRSRFQTLFSAISLLWGGFRKWP